MLAEALAGLASAGGTALVTAMVTDGWEDVRTRVARVLGRGDAQETGAVAAQLEQSRLALAEVSGAALDLARAEQSMVWQTWLADLLERHPEAEGELRVLLAEVQSQVTGAAGQVEQHAVASGQAQQAVLGSGVQNVTFGTQHGTGASQG
jgi:hypothetical protein